MGANQLSYFETLGEHENQRCINVVDTVAVTVQRLVAHVHPLIYDLTLSRAARLRARAECILRKLRQSADLSVRLAIAKVHAMPATVHTLHPRKSPQPSLAALLALAGPDLGSVNQVILDRMQSPVSLIPELAGHLIAGGGKRLRPMLTLACARLLDYAGTRHHKLAACVEFIHTATLLHDDVVDASDLRRGRATANRLWGNPASVLVGDFLFSRSFELMVEDGSLRVLKILSHASAVIAEGEVAQLTAQREVETSEDRYLEIISAKTAILFAAACQIAAVVAERDHVVEAALEAYGRNLGIAFQLVDDAIDYVSDADTMGKDCGDDFRDGKVTLPVILAFARGSATDRQFWRDAMTGRSATDADLLRATELLKSSRAIDDTFARARHYGSRAIDALASFPNSSARAALIEAVEFAISRAY